MSRSTKIALIALLFAAATGLRGKIGFYLHFVPYFLSGPGPRVAECGEGPGFKYCLYDPPPGTPKDPEALLYFLHYGTGDEKSWARVPISRAFYAAHRERGVPAPTVVGVSYGSYWTLFEKAGRTKSPLFAEFVDRDMPWLEAKTGTPRRRILWGMSQGGLNGALLVLKKPALWAGAALSCPAFFAVSVFAPEEAKAEFARARRADRAAVDWGMSLVLNRIAGPEEWRKEDPLARAAAAGKLPPLYVGATRRDELGFFDGAQEFVRRLRERGQDVTFSEEDGGHCAIDAGKASEFLAGVGRPRE